MEFDHFKTVCQSSGCCLRRKALTPMLATKAPAHFDRRREMRLEGVAYQADEANELMAVKPFDRPEAVTMLIEAGLDSADEGIGLIPRQRRREMLHHLRVGVERREGRAVVVAPTTQEQSSGLEFHRHANLPR